MNRREFLKWLAATGGAIAIGHVIGSRFKKECPVTILAADSYEKDLTRSLKEVLATDLPDLKGKKVLLKPNFVEIHPQRPINTDVRLIAQVATACLSLGASEVMVGEAPGHRRDPWFSVHHPSLRAILDPRVKCIDLNHTDTVEVPNLGKRTGLGSFHLPRPIKEADIFISFPKMKTHHWMGVTLSLKNLFGTLPGTIYGWPKNILHFRGIGNSILDITQSIRVDYCIVDGIVGMEGDGPILGSPKPVGVVVLGKEPLAVDSTCSRLMGFDPLKIPYLGHASFFMHGLFDKNIIHRGESPRRFASTFACLPQFEKFRGTDFW